MASVVDKPKRQRSCVACGQKAGKIELFRIVRTHDGSVAFDKMGRAPGRGAYVCSEACLEKAVSQKRLDRALRTSLSNEDYERIAAEIADAMRRVTGE